MQKITTLNIERRLYLLTMDSWSIEDLMAYENINRAKAYQIKKKVRDAGGIVKFNPRKMKVETFFELRGVSRSKEIELLKLALSSPDLFVSANKSEK